MKLLLHNNMKDQPVSPEDISNESANYNEQCSVKEKDIPLKDKLNFKNIDDAENSNNLWCSNNKLHNHTKTMNKREPPENTAENFYDAYKFGELIKDDLAQLINSLKKKKMDIVCKKDFRKLVTESLTATLNKSLHEPALEIIAAQFFEGDNGISVDEKPDWLDLEKFRRGQKFARDHLLGISFSQILSMFIAYAFEHIEHPFLVTGNSGTPYASFKRFLSTSSRFISWYTSDPWTRGTQAYKDMKFVRRLHNIVRRKMENMSAEELTKITTLENPWCPALNATLSDFRQACPKPMPFAYFSLAQSSNSSKISQADMMVAQFTFVGFIVTKPWAFGIHNASDEDLEAFCHVWRSIGYLLGIDDEYNFCRGSLKNIQADSNYYINFLIKPHFQEVNTTWEHLMRCLLEGLSYYFPLLTYRASLLKCTDIFDLPMTKIYDEMSYLDWISLWLLRFYFNYGSRYSGIRSLANYLLYIATTIAKNYDRIKHKKLKEKSLKTMVSCTVNVPEPASVNKCKSKLHLYTQMIFRYFTKFLHLKNVM